jgi:hypothetical protein
VLTPPPLSTTSLGVDHANPPQKVEITIASRGYADKLMHWLTFARNHDLTP